MWTVRALLQSGQPQCATAMNNVWLATQTLREIALGIAVRPRNVEVARVIIEEGPTDGWKVAPHAGNGSSKAETAKGLIVWRRMRAGPPEDRGR